MKDIIHRCVVYKGSVLIVCLTIIKKGYTPSRIQHSAVSEHANNTGHYPLWDEVKFIDRDPHWYSDSCLVVSLQFTEGTVSSPNNANTSSDRSPATT